MRILQLTTVILALTLTVGAAQAQGKKKCPEGKVLDASGKCVTKRGS